MLAQHLGFCPECFSNHYADKTDLDENGKPKEKLIKPLPYTDIATDHGFSDADTAKRVCRTAFKKSNFLYENHQIRLSFAKIYAIIFIYLYEFSIKEVVIMAVSYKKLWKLLIDKDMKKSDLEREAKITHYSLSKLSQGKDVSTEVLGKICETLDCTIDDIMEFVPEEK